MRAEAKSMARGWESKSVEAQIESAESRPRVSGRALTAEETAAKREREMLELSRRRVLRELESSVNPRYVELMKRELEALEIKLGN
jgi:hypothetical protein